MNDDDEHCDPPLTTAPRTTQLDQETLRLIQETMRAAFAAGLRLARLDLEPRAREILDHGLSHGMCCGVTIECRGDAMTVGMKLRDPDDAGGIEFWRLALEPSGSASVQ